MESYGGSNDGSQSDWVGAGQETGLEEPMWQLGLESDGGGGGGASESQYPERPDEANCIYYLRTGYCGYGLRCRYNHPKDRNTVTDDARAGTGDYPERLGQPICQFYMKTGTCKFGSSCKYHHPRQGPDSTGPVLLNYYGYPLRLGEKECSYYVKTGQCKFGSTCKFHHPQPAGLPGPIQVPALQFGTQVGSVPTPLGPTLYPPMQSPAVPSSQQYGVVMSRPPMLPPMVPGPYGPFLLPPSMVPFQVWNPYQVPVSPVSSSTAQLTSRPTSMYGMTQLSPSAPAFMGPFQPSLSSIGHSVSTQKEPSLPERPGQPDCEYFVKTGYCRYGSSCRYHHPPVSMIQNANTVISPSGLPLRPGALQCLHYSQYGECKYGSSCKFEHSIGIRTNSPSASSLAEVTAISYSGGSSSGTLAPSSSSSELRDEPTSSKSGSSSVKCKSQEDRRLEIASNLD